MPCFFTGNMNGIKLVCGILIIVDAMMGQQSRYISGLFIN